MFKWIFQIFHIGETPTARIGRLGESASVKYLKASPIEHEFRTTVVREFHTKDDLIKIAKWIQGSEHYYLQQYTETSNVIQPGWSAYSKDEMMELLEAVQKYVPTAELRGVKEG